MLSVRECYKYYTSVCIWWLPITYTMAHVGQHVLGAQLFQSRFVAGAGATSHRIYLLSLLYTHGI